MGMSAKLRRFVLHQFRQCRSHSKMRTTYFCFRGIAGIIFPTQIIEAPPPTNWMTQKRNKYGNWTK